PGRPRPDRQLLVVRQQPREPAQDHHRRPPRQHARAPRAARRDPCPPGWCLRLVAVAYSDPVRGTDGTTVTDFSEPRLDHPPRPLAQRVGAIAWPSFFAAGVSTMVFFAFVDPLVLRDITFPGLPMTRELGYTLGFFIFWLATASSSLFTWILLRPSSRFNRALPPE